MHYCSKFFSVHFLNELFLTLTWTFPTTDSSLRQSNKSSICERISGDRSSQSEELFLQSHLSSVTTLISLDQCCNQLKSTSHIHHPTLITFQPLCFSFCFRLFSFCWSVQKENIPEAGAWSQMWKLITEFNYWAQLVCPDKALIENGEKRGYAVNSLGSGLRSTLNWIGLLFFCSKCLMSDRLLISACCAVFVFALGFNSHFSPVINVCKCMSG